MRVVCQHVHSELLADFLLEIDLSLVSLEVAVDDDTVLVDCRETYIVAVAGFLASSGERNGVILGERSAVEGILPVVVRPVFIVFHGIGFYSCGKVFIGRLEICICMSALSIDFSLKIHELIAIHQFHLVCNLVHRPGCGEIDFWLAFGTLLCCNYNDTVGSAGSVNGCCRSIFEDVDGFDISRAEGCCH